MLRIATVVSLAFSLALLGQQARAQSDAVPLSVEGQGFSIATLHSGGGAYANRNYTWEGVPPQIEGWSFTKTRGGEPPDIIANSSSDGTVYIAVDSTTRSLADGIPGWELVPNLSFTLTDKKRTSYAIFRTHHVAGTPLTIPRFYWGGIILSPSLTRINESAESVSPAVVVAGAPVIHSRVVAGSVVVHPHYVHVVERHVVHHVYRRDIEVRRAAAVHTVHAKRPPIKAGGRL